MNEPIHIPGSVQEHGVLLVAAGASLELVQVSESILVHLGVPAADALGRPLLDLFDEASAGRLREVSTVSSLRVYNPLRLVSRSGAVFDAVLHRTAGERRLVVELEPHELSPVEPSATFDPRLRRSISRLQEAASVEELHRITVEEVQHITGFDRVMLYQFDADWNGQVVAEVKRDDLPPFLGQHYPASDIPAQARRLYTANWLRFIADVRSGRSPIVPVLDPEDGAPLDLSGAALRSVSPIHLEYLGNMGVRASMSVSLVIDGALAGLIACHHYSGPRLVPFRARDTSEYLGRALSWQLGVLRRVDLAAKTNRAREHEATLLRRIVGGRDLLHELCTEPLLALAGGTGAAVVLREGTATVGSCPSPEIIASLVAWLSAEDRELLVTDRLGEVGPLIPAEKDADRATGLLAVAVSKELGEYILWFRCSTERTIDWAGDPAKVEVRLDDALPEAGGPPRLSPRGSFALWRQTVRGRSTPWGSWEIEAATSLRGALLGGIRKRAVELSEVNDRLEEADRLKDAFLATVSHELRTPLSSITGWTQLLQTGGMDAPQIAHALEVIARNARAQTQLVEDLLDISRITSDKLTLDVESVDLTLMIDSVCEALRLSVEAKGLRLRRIVDPSAGAVLGDGARLRQVFSNLLTNAVKFTPKGGKITVVLKRLSSDVELSVSDSGCGISPAFLPHVFESFRQEDPGMNRRSQGLGLGLAIVKKLVHLHGGSVSAESAGEDLGTTFRVRLPLSPLRAAEGPEPPRGSAPPVGTEELAGLRLLVVEDERDARELLGHLLTLRGATVTLASEAAQALALAQVESFDVIVSDIGLPGMDGLSVLRSLRSGEGPNARTPAVALTAYTRTVDRTNALKAGFQAHVPKPVDAAELVAVIASVTSRAK